MAILYPIIVVLIVDKVSIFEYFTSPVASFQALGQNLISLKPADIIILSSGLAGAVLSGIVIKKLRQKGYQMF
mgnify:CR=1 FL=1